MCYDVKLLTMKYLLFKCNALNNNFIVLSISIKITHFDNPKISIKGDWKNNIVVEASNIGLGVTADWRVKK